MSNDQYCETCGAKVADYKHSLSKALVRGLWRAAKAGYVSINPKDWMTTNQRANFQKLKYWDLIVKDRTKDAKGGFWFITPKGWGFIKGIISVPRHVWTYHGKRVRYEGLDVSIEDLTGGWKYRPEYAEEARPHA